MNSLKTFALLAAIAALGITSSRADHALASPRGQDLHPAVTASDTQDRIDRTFTGYTGRTPFETRTTASAARSVNAKECSMNCCNDGKKISVYTGRTGGLDVGAKVKEACKPAACSMPCCKKG